MHRHLNSGHEGEAGHDGEDVEGVWYCEICEPEHPPFLHALNRNSGHPPQCKEEAYKHRELDKGHHHQLDRVAAMLLVNLKHASHLLGSHDLVARLLILLDAPLHLVQLRTKVVEDGCIPLHLNDNWSHADSQRNSGCDNSGPPREMDSGVERIDGCLEKANGAPPTKPQACQVALCGQFRKLGRIIRPL